MFYLLLQEGRNATKENSCNSIIYSVSKMSSHIYFIIRSIAYTIYSNIIFIEKFFQTLPMMILLQNTSFSQNLNTYIFHSKEIMMSE